jgi:oligoendopeptidase F
MLPAWNLSDLYANKNDPKLTKDLNFLNIETKLFNEKYINEVKNLNAQQLLEAIKNYEKISDIEIKIATYAYLYFVTDMLNHDKAGFYQNISEKLNAISEKIIFFQLEIADLAEKNLNKLLEDKDLKKYKSFILDIRSSKKYQKSRNIEEILHKKHQTSNHAWSRLFDETMAGLEFNYDKKNLSAAEIFNILSSNDKEKRKKAAKSIGQTLEKNIKIFAFITNILAKDKAIDDEIRNYEHPVKARNVSNFIEDEVVNSLVTTVKENYQNFSHEYYHIKAQLFGCKQLDYWDRNAPFDNLEEQEISYQEAQKIVLTAYNNFSSQMAEIAELFFKNNWIDVPPRKGKDSGAFSHPSAPSTHPYIMLNYQGKIRDVMTLAHELGHGIHQYLSRKQGALMADTPLTLAETASIFGEQLVFESLLNQAKTKDEKKFLLINKIEDSLNTIIRQIAFYDFEYQLHHKRKTGELTINEINEIWLKTQQDSLGSALKFHAEYKYFWSYIPHFIHSPFYVYAYAFGNLLVNSLYLTYKSGLKDFEKKYIHALSAGGTLHHKELLAPFGLDASNKNFWQEGLKLPLSYLNELKELLK